MSPTRKQQQRTDLIGRAGVVEDQQDTALGQQRTVHADRLVDIDRHGRRGNPEPAQDETVPLRGADRTSLQCDPDALGGRGLDGSHGAITPA